METLEFILLLAVAVVISSVIDQMVPKISAPLVQIGLGVVIALLAVTPVRISLSPELFLVLFIAPLLFHDAKHADKSALWKNKRTILSLAIGLVVLITLCVGFFLNLLVPSIPLAAAFALGAALGPTDAVAVASLSKEAQLDRTEHAILSGESLLNDASGVVSFQFAIAAAVTEVFSVWEASLSFVISFFGGIILGALFILVGNYVARFIRARGLETVTSRVLFDVSTPFIIYLLSEVCGVSGILAVVTAGLIASSLDEKSLGPSTARYNIVSSSVWRVLAFTLNGIVFILLGMQLPMAMQSTWGDVQIDNGVLIGYVLLLTLLIVAVRFAWLAVSNWMHRDQSEQGIPIANDKAMRLKRLKSALVATVGGPKGAITLSIIFSIPYYVASGNSFPQRELIIFLASGVILCTLLLANFVLPLLAPREAKEEIEADEPENGAAVQIEILRNVVAQLSAAQTPENSKATQKVIASYNSRIAQLQEKHNIDVAPDGALRIAVARHQQDIIVELIEKGEIDPVIAYRYEARLAQVQNYLKHENDYHWVIRNALRHLRITMRVAWHMITSLAPTATRTNDVVAMRELQISSEKEAVAFLRKILKSPDSEYPAETVSALITEHQRAISTLRRALPSITAITKTSDVIGDIQREGIRLELEQIQELYDDERLSRQMANQLRDNLHLMQLDLDGHM